MYIDGGNKKLYNYINKAKEGYDMKNMLKKLYCACLAAVPVCAAFMMSTVVNSTTCWIQGQDELPENAKKYRKF